MAYPSSPVNNQIFERADGQIMRYRSASNSWVRVPRGKPSTETLITTLGASVVTIPEGALKVRVRACGGGGAGGNSNGVSWNHGAPGGGSGFGGEALISLTGATAMDVIVGAGGAGTTTAASDGGDTTVNVTGVGSLIFGGGKAGLYTPADPGGAIANVPGGDGGALSGTLVSLVMGGSDSGGNGIDTNVGAAGTGASGQGGSGKYGTGGKPQGALNGLDAPATAAGDNGSGYGAGGSGSSARSGSPVAAKGGNGAPGITRLEWIY